MVHRAPLKVVFIESNELHSSLIYLMSEVLSSSNFHLIIEYIDFLNVYYLFLGNWPWIVTIGYKIPDKNNSQLHWGCGGSLITNKHVLTTAYCLDNDIEGLRP